MQAPYEYIPNPAPNPGALEKRQARLVGNSVGGAMLMVSGISILISLVVSAIISFIPGGAELYTHPLFEWAYQIVVSTILFTLPFLLLPCMSKAKLGQIFAAKRVRAKLFVPLVMLTLGVAALGNYGTGILSQITDALGIGGADISDLGTPEGVWGFLLMLIGSALVPALVEEFAMRGVALGVARKYLGDTLAIFFTSIVFALMHRNVSALPFTFVGGVVFAYVTVYANSVWPAVVGHFLNNFLATLTTRLEQYLTPTMAELLYLGYTFAFVVVGLVGFIWFTKQNRDAFVVQGYNGQQNQKTVLKWALTAPCVVIYMILFVLESVLLAWVM